MLHGDGATVNELKACSLNYSAAFYQDIHIDTHVTMFLSNGNLHKIINKMDKFDFISFINSLSRDYSYIFLDLRWLFQCMLGVNTYPSIWVGL